MTGTTGALMWIMMVLAVTYHRHEEIAQPDEHGRGAENSGSAYPGFWHGTGH
jgi:hypothetical protein